MIDVTKAESQFPIPLDAYPPPSPEGLIATISTRVAADPFNAIATTIFLLAIVHTFMAPRFAALAHRVQHDANERARAAGQPTRPSVAAELLHFLGEIEVVFGMWAAVLLIAITAAKGWEVAKHYFAEGVNYTEPLFVIVIMALAGTRPIVTFAENSLRRVARVGGATPAAWWVVILTIGPLLGSFITEPAAMTICAMLLARQFYDLEPSTRLKFATLSLSLRDRRWTLPPVLNVVSQFLRLRFRNSVYQLHDLAQASHRSVSLCLNRRVTRRVLWCGPMSLGSLGHTYRQAFT